MFSGIEAEPFGEDTCPVCKGELCFMGTLGRLDWFQCRQCGHETSKENES